MIELNNGERISCGDDIRRTLLELLQAAVNDVGHNLSFAEAEHYPRLPQKLSIYSLYFGSLDKSYIALRSMLAKDKYRQKLAARPWQNTDDMQPTMRNFQFQSIRQMAAKSNELRKTQPKVDPPSAPPKKQRPRRPPTSQPKKPKEPKQPENPKPTPEVIIMAKRSTVSNEDLLKWYWEQSKAAGKWLSSTGIDKHPQRPATYITYRTRFKCTMSELRDFALAAYGSIYVPEPEGNPDVLTEADRQPETYLELSIQITGFEPVELSQKLIPKA